MAENINIAGRLHSTATGNVVAGANEIYDDTKGKKQSVVNQETEAAIQAEIERATEAENDRYTKSETYSKTELNNMITTPNQQYVTVATYASLPASGSADTIYRVSSYNGSTSQVDSTMYSEYAWNGSDYVFLCVKSQIDEVFDITVYNSNTKYADLSAALGVNGVNIPESLRKGGMSVKYVQSSDNKYVQYRCIADSFTTDVAQWQGVDDEIKAGSKNLARSGDVYKAIAKSLISALVNESGFFITDENLNAVVKYNSDGFDVAKVSTHFCDILKAALAVSFDINKFFAKTAEDGFFFVDSGLNIGVKIDTNGIQAKNILNYQILNI